MRAAIHHARIPLLVAILASAWFAVSGRLVFPMDDAYIHFVYARNLADHGLLTFNLFPPDGGLGTTSCLWPLLLAALDPLLGVLGAARLLGILSYLAVALLVTELARWMTPRDKPWAAPLAATMTVLSGNLLWFSFSGMETMLWLSLGLGAVVAYRHQRYPATGVLLGLMALTRLEGLALLVALVGVDLWFARRLRREMVVVAALALLCLLPWVMYVHSRTGQLTPTSFSGKKHAQVRGALELLSDTMGVEKRASMEGGALPWYVIFIYPIGVVGYLFGFVLGGTYLPPPRIPLAGRVGELTGGISVFALAGLVYLFGPAIWAVLKRARYVAMGDASASDQRRRALLALAAWFTLHNLAYWAILPTPGTASRYQVVNHVAFWLLSGVGIWMLKSSPRVRQGAVALMLGWALWNAVYWHGVYRSNVAHMTQVRLAAAVWAADHLPTDAVVAAHDIGALGWRMNRRMLDLGSLIDPAFLEYGRTGRVADFLRDKGATYVILPTKHSSEAEGFADYAVFLDLAHNPEFRLEPVQSFENDYQSWRQGAMATWNALPAVTIYRLRWTP